MGLGSFLRKAISIAAPIVGVATGGFGLGLGAIAGGALGGAAGGAIAGKGLKGAAIGAGLGAAGGYLSGSTGLKETIGAGANRLGYGSAAYDYLDAGGGASTGLSSLLGSMGGSSSAYSALGSNALNSALSSNAYDSAISKLNAGLGQYSNTGLSANAQLAKMLGLNENASEDEVRKALEATPGFQFEQQQGEQAINRSLGAQGKVFSGEALKAAGKYNTGLASKYYQNAVGNLSNASNAGYNASASLADAKAQAKLEENNALTSGLASYFSPVRYY